ncbi:DUF4271 domain-containing protein [Flagellimonas beolgyonensis]|uniref:DUF4271 domain-containing protein n=1 Tax=Flagellimonas beolgyonensis TaxID=864064 RepID=UPI000F8EDC37|nr:DUF4271 domain-containing protein [Allomuricauda beolgyonensis]
MNPIEKTVFSLDWMTLILFSALILLTLGKYLYYSKFVNFIILPFNDKYILLYNKKGQLFNWFHSLLTLFQWINLSLFILLALETFGYVDTADQLSTYFLILGSVALFELTKFTLQSFTGYVFNMQDLISGLIFSKTSYLNYSSILIFVANVLLIYVLRDSKPIIYGTIFLICLIIFISAIKLLKNYQKALFPYFVYFILYLCALEIAPLVLIGSYLKG